MDAMLDAIARAGNMRTTVDIDEHLMAKAGTLVGTMSGHPESMARARDPAAGEGLPCNHGSGEAGDHRHAQRRACVPVFTNPHRG